LHHSDLASHWKPPAPENTKISKVTLGLIQTAVDADPAANLDKAITKTIEAAKAGAQIV
jgi:hypothetical protein